MYQGCEPWDSHAPPFVYVTIVSDADLKVRYQKGGYLGTVEEWFVAKLKLGDIFTFQVKILN